MSTEELHNHINAKMKLFQTLRRNLAIVKFDPNQTDSFFGLIRQHCSCFSQSSLSIVSLTLYLVHDANSVKEYMDSMFLTTAAVTIFASFSSTVFKTPELYTLLNNAETVGNDSELIYLRFIHAVRRFETNSNF